MPWKPCTFETIAGDALIQYAIELNAIEVIDRLALEADSFRAESVDHPNLSTVYTQYIYCEADLIMLYRKLRVTSRQSASALMGTQTTSDADRKIASGNQRFQAPEPKDPLQISRSRTAWSLTNFSARCLSFSHRFFYLKGVYSGTTSQHVRC